MPGGGHGALDTAQGFLRCHVDSFCFSSTPPPPPHGHTLTPFPCLELRVSVYTSWAVLGTSGNLPGPVFLLCKMETGKICLVALPRPLGQPAPVSSWGGRAEASWARLPFCGTPAWATISKHLLRTNYKPSCEPVPPVSAAPTSAPYRQAASETPHQEPPQDSLQTPRSSSLQAHLGKSSEHPVFSEQKSD